MKIIRWILILILLLVAAGSFAPMTLMVDPGDPLYLIYTTIWNLTAGFLLLPPDMISSLFNLPGNHFLTYTLEAFWLFTLIVLVYRLPKYFSQNPSKQNHNT